MVGRVELVVMEAVGSTSEMLKAGAQSGAGETALLARRQTAGHGRLGRPWWSGEGNLQMSVSLRPAVLVGPGRAPGHWAILAGVALLEAVRSAAPAAVLRLKWPNDLLFAGGKVAGVLVEAGLGDGAAGAPWLVIGFGVNLVAAPSQLGRPVACLADMGAAPEVVAFGRAVLDAMLRWRGRYDREGFGPIRAAWLAAGPASGEAVTMADGTAGTFAGLGDDGALLLADGRAIRTGELA